MLYVWGTHINAVLCTAYGPIAHMDVLYTHTSINFAIGFLVTSLRTKTVWPFCYKMALSAILLCLVSQFMHLVKYHA